MNKTANYQLTIPTGSDIFNPLTQTVPNFTTIDSQMKTNQDNSVSPATCSLASNKYVIQRTYPNQMFRFVAPANYQAGQTFTVDGAIVTAKLPNGDTLQTGAFLQSSHLIGFLDGSSLTIFTFQNPDYSSEFETLTQAVKSLNDLVKSMRSYHVINPIYTNNVNTNTRNSILVINNSGDTFKIALGCKFISSPQTTTVNNTSVYALITFNDSSLLKNFRDGAMVNLGVAYGIQGSSGPFLRQFLQLYRTDTTFTIALPSSVGSVGDYYFFGTQVLLQTGATIDIGI